MALYCIVQLNMHTMQTESCPFFFFLFLHLLLTRKTIKMQENKSCPGVHLTVLYNHVEKGRPWE